MHKKCDLSHIFYASNRFKLHTTSKYQIRSTKFFNPVAERVNQIIFYLFPQSDTHGDQPVLFLY